MIDLLALAVLVVSLGTIAIIVGRKFPLLASVQTSARAERLEQKKSSLIEQRLRRKFTGWWQATAEVAGPAGQRVSSWWQQAHRKLVDLEHEYKVRSLPVFLNRRQRHKLDTEIHALLEQAQALEDEGEYTAAEDQAMQAIRLEPRSVPAFEFLGQLYLQTNEYAHAKEVYRYLMKLVGESDAIYEHLGEAELGDGDLQAAQRDFEKAAAINDVETTYLFNLAKVDRLLAEWPLAFERIQEVIRREPNNPKFLDEYIEICLGDGKKQFAEDALKKLQEVNPENTKIPDWQQRIAAMAVKPIVAAVDDPPTMETIDAPPTLTEP